jgi:hypothetical protein
VFASRADFQEATQKVKNKKKHNDKSRIQQEFPAVIREPNKIAASTHYDFRGKQLTPYGGLFPVATMLAAAHSTGTGVGSGQRRTEVHHSGHRHHRAHRLWPAVNGTVGMATELR